MSIKIAITNKKGGIGKSTTALALASSLTHMGYRVLMVDTDPQRNTTSVYQAQIEDVATLYDIFFGEKNEQKKYSAKECIQYTDYGDIIASDELLQDADSLIKPSPKMYQYIKNALKQVENEYDFILFDTPPNTGVLVGNVLMATDYIITPCTCDGFGLQGIVDFYSVIQDYMDINSDLKYLGLLIVKYKGRQKLTQDIEDNVLPAYAEQMDTRIFNTKIRECVKCQEAQTLNRSLFDYANNSTTCQDYQDLTEEILNILNIDKTDKTDNI